MANRLNTENIIVTFGGKEIPSYVDDVNISHLCHPWDPRSCTFEMKFKPESSSVRYLLELSTKEEDYKLMVTVRGSSYGFDILEFTQDGIIVDDPFELLAYKVDENKF